MRLLPRGNGGEKQQRKKEMHSCDSRHLGVQKVPEKEALGAKSINTQSSVSMDPHGHNEDLDSSAGSNNPGLDLSAATAQELLADHISNLILIYAL